MACTAGIGPPRARSSSHRISMRIVALFLLAIPSVYSTNKLYLNVIDLHLLVGESQQLTMTQIGEFNRTLTVEAVIQYTDIIKLEPSTIDIAKTTEKKTYKITASGEGPGFSEVTFKVTPPGFVNVDNMFLRVRVMISKAINVISIIMGWVYFAAWSVSFYPQIYSNYKRKSVVGLNFDFLSLNIMGFVMYSLFNCGLYFLKKIKAQYFERHPRGYNPVQLNDVFFSIHAACASSFTVYQCTIYERGHQRVSLTARAILSVFFVIAAVTAVVAMAGKMQWLDQLYCCSYIKLCITFIKYLPQAYMNYKRKSTVGWSIGNIFLDFTGGILSILQMLLNSYNFDDWASIFGDATKFGLGLFSLSFDIFFMLQHYVFYRKSRQVQTPTTGNVPPPREQRPPGRPDTTIAMPSEKTTDKKTMDDKPTGEKTTDAKTTDAKTMGAKTTDAKTTDAETTNATTTNATTTNATTPNAETTNENTTDKRTDGN